MANAIFKNDALYHTTGPFYQEASAQLADASSTLAGTGLASVSGRHLSTPYRSTDTSMAEGSHIEFGGVDSTSVLQNFHRIGTSSI